MMHPSAGQLVYYYPPPVPVHAHAPKAHRPYFKNADLVNQTVKINKGHFHFIKRLGNGAFGVVYSARDTANNRPVAVKVVSLDPGNPGMAQGLTSSILSEIRMSKRLAKISPHIVHMFDFDFDANLGKAFIVMELGQADLNKTLSKRPRLNPQERKVIWKQLVHIAVILDQRGIVHLDIKPDNLLVFPGNQIKLADLGIAQKANTHRNAPNGTPGFSAPEVVLGPQFGSKNSSRSDVWSWGAVLYWIAYFAGPEYNPGAHAPPRGTPPSKDQDMVDVLRHTLVPLDRRVDVAWLTNHPLTRS